MNNVTLLGNLGSNPESLSTPENRVAKLSLATTSAYTDKNGEVQKETTWHTVFFYGKKAEALLKYFKSGQEILVSGSIRTSKYKDKDGVERTGYFIKGEEWYFTRGNGGKPSDKETTSESQVSTPTVSTTGTPQKPNTTVSAPKTTANKPLAATVATTTVSHTEEDLSGFSDSDPTADDLPF